MKITFCRNHIFFIHPSGAGASRALLNKYFKLAGPKIKHFYVALSAKLKKGINLLHIIDNNVEDSSEEIFTKMHCILQIPIKFLRSLHGKNV